MSEAILLMGPTGAGKTDAALEIATRLPVEIVSVDSTMVYRGLDVGSAKPSKAILARFPHHLVDICEPDEPYSTGSFVRDVVPLIRDIRSRGRWPLLVGGTMLYFRALQGGLANLPSADASLRSELSARAARIGWPKLHEELARVDPVAAARIAPNDSQRIQRALEVHALTGKPLSLLQQQALKTASPPDYLRLVLAPESKLQLNERLERRFDSMMAEGFLDEVQRLYARGTLHADLPSLRSVGYRQLWNHLEGHSTLQQARELSIIATRQLAKRQYTWLRAEPSALWVSPHEPGAIDKLCQFIGEWVMQRTVM